MAGGIDSEIDTFKDGEKILVLKTYKEIKPHSSEEREDKLWKPHSDNNSRGIRGIDGLCICATAQPRQLPTNDGN